MLEENNYSRIPVIEDPFLKEKNAPYTVELTLEQITDLLFILDCYRHDTLKSFNNSSLENQSRTIFEYDRLISNCSNFINLFLNRLTSEHLDILSNKNKNLKRIKEKLSWRWKDDFEKSRLESLYHLKNQKKD